MHVGVDTDVARASVRQDQNQVRGLSPHPRQREQLLHRRWHHPAEPAHDLLARPADMNGLVAVEAHRINQLLDLLDRKLDHRPGRARYPEEAGGSCCGHGVRRLRRQHRRDEDLERILLLVLRDLFDGRLVQTVDRVREPAHHCANPRARQNRLIRKSHGVEGQS